MFGGEDAADTLDVDAKLPDGLGAHEGQETLEAGREVRRRERKLLTMHDVPDIPSSLRRHGRRLFHLRRLRGDAANTKEAGQDMDHFHDEPEDFSD